MTRPDHGPHARKELRDRTGWPLETLRYELAYQRPNDPGLVTTVGLGRCGHVARGSGFCGDCIEAEIERRKREAAK